MSYLKSVILGLLGGFAVIGVIGLLPFIAILVILAGFIGQIKINEEKKANEMGNNRLQRQQKGLVFRG